MAGREQSTDSTEPPGDTGAAATGWQRVDLGGTGAVVIAGSAGDDDAAARGRLIADTVGALATGAAAVVTDRPSSVRRVVRVVERVAEQGRTAEQPSAAEHGGTGAAS